MKIRRNKKGIELSASFMVTLILAIVVFALGIGFFTDLFKKANEMKERLDSQTEKEIRNLLLTSGDKVSIPYDKKQVRKGKDTVIAVGVYNTLRTNSSDDVFIISAGDNGGKANSCANRPGESGCDSSNVVVTNPDTRIKIRKTDTEVIPIIAEVNNGVSGETYIFNVRVCNATVDSTMTSCNSATYGRVTQFYINII